MAYSKVLNRPMFNKHNSAYGRGIASNLVTEEQRQRFNYGGRVGFQDAGDVYAQTRVDIGKLGQRPTEEMFETEWTKYNYPYDSGLYAADPYSDMMGGGIYRSDKDKALFDYYSGKGTGEGAPTTLEEGKESWRKEKSKVAERMRKYDEKMKKLDPDYKIPGEKVTETVEIDDVGEENLPIDSDSDQLYTDEEKKEKRSQMMLSMAERLIGGSRDKWGSTAQMKNISEAIGDIRKIADPSERREMLAKYKAWGKAQADRDKAMYSDDMLVKQLISKGAGPRRAKESVYFGEDITQMARGDSGKAIRKAFAENKDQFKIIFDEERQVYIIPSLGKEVTSIEDLIKLRKQKKI